MLGDKTEAEEMNAGVLEGADSSDADALPVYNVTVGTDTVEVDVMSVAVDRCVTAVSSVSVTVVP